ncbi:MurR/RpiR family transcriptional regulator [Martelella soudanensis]|uniref:MurR/RpiR family transcriptional regulator n=1 Tax=unclassified Martelella TaxID=2629616 RepID=UPI0015DF6D95|nr:MULTISPECIES: MurR/RpiR family transcriptional regulator [unclassified Martelella]
MSPENNPAFLTRVRNQLADMHPAERRLAEFVLTFPGEIASYSASELARLANVSNATISRFIQRLGYVNYDDARRRVRAEKEGGAAIFLGATNADTPDQRLASHLEQAQANLNRTFATISMPEIDAVATAMIEARRVWITGFRTGQPFASYLRWQTLQAIDQVYLFPGPGETLAEYLTSIEAGDVLILFGLKRRTASFGALLKQVVRSKAKILLISDESLERRSDVDWHVQCQTPAPGPLFNHAAVLAYCHVLATRVVELSGKPGRKRLSAIEVAHDLLDEL